MPTVAMYLTLHNRERFVVELLDSVLAQTLTDWRLYVRDDGSADNSLAVARGYADRDTRVTVFAGENLGQVQGRAELSRMSVGSSEPFIAFLDDDDVLHPQCLEKTVAALSAAPTAGFVYTKYIDIDDRGRRLGPGYRCEVPYSRDRLLVDFMTFHFRLIRRSVFDAVGGNDVNSDYADDYDLCLRLSEAADVVHVPEPLYAYRLHPDSISSTQRLKQIEASKQAIDRALVRRGLCDKVELNVELTARFTLRRK